ncbi:hypothetical protein ZWY2020_015310 [Hordeum vulgare]|nr:hypothetical protein ZWY2020_015310 [Hordeum vulgare]
MMMDMGDGVFLELNAREVAKATGLPPGGRKVDIRAGQCLADREVLLAKVHAILGTDMPRSNSIPIYKVKKTVQSASKDAIQGDERTAMKAAVTLLASSTFLVPRGATAKIANELLPVVAEPDNIAEFDFCDYVVEGLREAARKLREDLSMDVANVKLEGCLIVPQIMWLDYHEHGLHGRETLQLPRIGHYSDTKLKDLIRKHATAQGIECGPELGDVPRSPAISVPGSCSQWRAGDCQQMVGHASGSRSAAGPVDMDNLPLLPTKVVEAFKATMEFHYKRCEVEMMKVVDNMRDKIAVEIRAASSAKRQRDAEEALDFFIGQVKKQASLAVASQVRVPHQASGSAAPKVHVTHGASASTSAALGAVARDLAAISREAAKSMMELDVCAQHSADAGASCSHGLTDASTKGQPAVIPVEEYFAQEEEYGFSPFELELSHADLYPDHVCQNFYEDFIYLSCAKSLSSLGGAMFHNGMEAWVRGFNEREKKMFDRVGLPVSRGLLSPDVPLHMENTWNKEAPSMLRSLMSTSSLGYALRLCRMIMVPIAFDRDWCFGESPGYIAYYADNFNGTRLEEDIPRAGLASRRKRMLYKTLAVQCNTAPRTSFMVQVAEEI